jgi:hypothetical protein
VEDERSKSTQAVEVDFILLSFKRCCDYPLQIGNSSVQNELVLEFAQILTLLDQGRITWLLSDHGDSVLSLLRYGKARAHHCLVKHLVEANLEAGSYFGGT